MARVADEPAIELDAGPQRVQEQIRENLQADAPSGPRTPEALADLFSPDLVLPEQFTQGYREDSFISGEKALMLAVLEDGIRCFQEHLRNPRSNPRLLSQESEAWIKADDWEWPFSFNNVCETLGIDPDALRSSLLRWKAQRLAERDDTGRPTPTEKKVYRLHLRTKRMSGIR
ncbi:MAG: hypothetical protein U0807_01730 [Candidatus Binatia bacterium]